MNEFHDQIADGKTDKVGDMTVEKKIKSKYGIDVVNTVVLKSLASNKAWGEVVKENETALIRCIGINIETRPDLISEQEIHRLRFLGVTKVEMGVQTTDDKIHKLTKRGHLIAEVRKATQLLKDAGFKVGYHMMPNLPGTSPKKDIEMIRELFENQDFQPDYLKIYPCVVIPGTELSKMYKAGDFKPYNENVLEDVLFESICFVPEWCRIDRIARDIPSNEVEFGFKKSNIRQILEKRLVEEGRNCKDIRYREIRAAKFQDKDVKLVVRKYEASGGKEFFISFEDVKKDKLVALLRLRLPGSNFISELEDAALIREVHVYGKQIPVGEKGRGYSQHIGWGTKLMNEAERIASEAGFKKIAVISAIGTREYYKKKKYELKGTYMVKMI
jgi:elongator complex protein 3